MTQESWRDWTWDLVEDQIGPDELVYGHVMRPHRRLYLAQRADGWYWDAVVLMEGPPLPPPTYEPGQSRPDGPYATRDEAIRMAQLWAGMARPGSLTKISGLEELLHLLYEPPGRGEIPPTG